MTFYPLEYILSAIESVDTCTEAVRLSRCPALAALCWQTVDQALIPRQANFRSAATQVTSFVISLKNENCAIVINGS